MNALSTCMVATTMLLGLCGPATAQKSASFDVLSNPDFRAATIDYAGGERLELAARLNMVLLQYEQAIPMYEALVAHAPTRADLWAMLAAAYNRRDEGREALDAADIAITLAPHATHFYIERGIAAFRLGEHERSVSDLKHFVAAFPVNARARYYLGLAQAALGDVKAARDNLLRARALNPALALPTEYYLALIEAGEGRIALSQKLLVETRRAFEDSALPEFKALIARQSTEMNQRVTRSLRTAQHESDARHAALPVLQPDRQAAAGRSLQ